MTLAEKVRVPLKSQLSNTKTPFSQQGRARLEKDSLNVLIQMTKAKYLPGMRIRLVKMDDAQVPPVGTEGTVRGVDDIGSILVAWDTGGSLNVVLGEDEVEIIE